MIRDLARLVALWRPPQRVDDGKLLPEQIEIMKVELVRESDGRIVVQIEAHEPIIGEFIETYVEVTPELIAEKKAALGHHVITELTKQFASSIAAHPRADEARQFHHYPLPR